LTRQKLLIALIICLVIAWSFVLIDYGRQKIIQHDLEKQIITSSQALELLTVPAAGLEERLKESQTANQAAKISIAGGNINLTDMIDAILKLADQCHVKTTPVVTDTWSLKAVSGNTYKVMPVELKIQSNLSDLTQFIKLLEDPKLFPTLAFTELNITSEYEAENMEASEVEAPQVTADLTISIISQTEKAN
jgi:hypothetical protein